MVTNSTDSSKSTKLHAEQRAADLLVLTRKINQLKKEIQEERAVYVEEKLQRNKSRVESDVAHLLSISMSKTVGDPSINNMLSLRIENPVELITGEFKEVNLNATAKLPFVEKIPPYTTWTLLTRNQRMGEDQSVIGKRYIYYEQIGGKAICSDSEEENIIATQSEVKPEFSAGEKRILRMVCQDYEPNKEVVEIIRKLFIGRSTSDIHEICNMVRKEDEENVSIPAEVEQGVSMLLEKSLTTCLDSFDSLFCRRCLVFDCSLHSYAQTVTTPSERQDQYPPESQKDQEPCSDQCYLLLQAPERRVGSSFIDDNSTEETLWKPLEKDLYLKGLEIFGRNSCLITRNLLSEFKTCIQVYKHMHDAGSSCMSGGDGNSRTAVDHEDQARPQLPRRKGRWKKHKHSWKSSGHPSIWKRIADAKNHANKQYTPCQCKGLCGKDCSCQKNSTCCEKYCGCSKSCKNRFRGCHCAKSQCRSLQCPCFAAGRECDPDICRNCWVSCGDGSLGEPPRRGEGQCGNMRLLLQQNQSILLGKSDVAGWGAFVKNSVNKDEYLGEYTGELISTQEADVRGHIYERKKSASFLFNVNDQYVLDALRKGDKLKFANHSKKPNCYAKIIKVAGDHRVAIFSKERIEAGQELFYDYCYGPDQAPIWACTPDEGSSVPQGRGKKHQSHR